MLSITTIKPEQGERYYASENYYSKEELQQHSQWWGRGTQALGLEGHIEPKAFKNLLHGYNSDKSQRLTGKAIDPKKHRAGVDLTFSAPKSLSLAALVNGDVRLEEAHKTAVNRTLSILEQRYAQTRVRMALGRQAVNTQNLVVAQFHHDTSREKDPQLHTHCVVMNATQLENGKWQSLHNDALYQQKMLLGMIYRNELALLVKKLGYEVEVNRDSLFEIKGYTQQHLDAFSKRRKQIKAAVGEEATAKQKAMATLKSRAKKGKESPRFELQREWQAQARELNIEHPQPVLLSDSTTVAATIPAAAIIQDSIEHWSERQVAFRGEDLEKAALQMGLGRVSFEELDLVVKNNSDLIETNERGRFTTQKALHRELATLRLMYSGQKSVEAITSQQEVEKYLENKSLTAGQHEAIALAVSTTDQFIAWQGVAGAGKTYALNEFRQIAQAQGYTLKGYAPSSEAAKVLGEEVGIEANTVARLLVSQQPQTTKSNQIWIVDEAGLLSAKDAHALLKRAQAEQARVILVGDRRQLSAVEAGNPFKSLQAGGIATAYLNESRRQKPQELRAAVDLVAEGKVVSGLQKLEDLGCIIQLKTDERRHNRVVKDYLSVPAATRAMTLILAGTNQEKGALTQHLRDALKEEGSLGQTATLTRLRAKDLTRVQASYAHHYEIGDIVIPVQAYKRLGLEKAEQYEVEAINHDTNTLTLRSLEGKTLEVDPAKCQQKTVYVPESLEIAVGDRLKWTRNALVLGHRNGQEIQVVAVNPQKQTAEILYSSGKREVIGLLHRQHLDHAWVSTTYSSQGKTANRVLVATDQMVSQESFYVAISRAKYELKIYTADKDQLVSLAQKSRAKENPTELLRDKTPTAIATTQKPVEPSEGELFKIQKQREAQRQATQRSEQDYSRRLYELYRHDVTSTGVVDSKEVMDAVARTALKVGHPAYKVVEMLRHSPNGKQSDTAVADLVRAAQFSLQQATKPKHVVKAKPETFVPPALDDKQWPDVRRYLVKSRGLPPDLVDTLHQKGALYADSNRNAVFLRTDGFGQATGAELLGTEEQRPKLELAPGTKPSAGWFRFVQGSSKLSRAVLTESPIETLSLAALEGEQHQEKTLYISVDEAEAFPKEALQRFVEQGGRVEVAFDADEQGDLMATQIIDSLPGATRRRPTQSRDWNNQLRYTRSRQALAAAVKQVSARREQPRNDPQQYILNAIKQDRATHASTCESDLKTAVRGLVNGYDLRRIQKDISTTSVLVKHWNASDTNSIQASAKTIQYVQELCSEAETHPLYYQELYKKYASDIRARNGHLLPREELDQKVALVALRSHSKSAVRSILKHSLAALVQGDEYVQKTLTIAQSQDQKQLPQESTHSSPGFELSD